MEQTQIEQLSLDYTPPARAGLVEDVARLLRYLAGRGFVPGRHILHDLEWNERHLRLVAETSAGEVTSGPGKCGYARTVDDSISRQDVDAVLRRMKAQREKMLERENLIRLVARRRGDSPS